MESGAVIRFPVADNPRLACGTDQQLNRIEISPFGLHWPELDEDLSFRGLIDGDHGQFQKKGKAERSTNASDKQPAGNPTLAMKEEPPPRC